MFLNKMKLTSIALLCLGAAAATTVGVLAQSGALAQNKPLQQTTPAKSGGMRGGRITDSAPTAASVPDYISQSRVMIVTRLEEELALARARLERTLKKVGSPDDPAAVHARKTVDALEQLLTRVDGVLVDAVEAYPTMFDFSGAPAEVSSLRQPPPTNEAPLPILESRPAPFAPQNQFRDGSNLKRDSAQKDPFTERPVDAQLEWARARLDWALDMYKRGYVSKAAVEFEQKNVARLASLLTGKQAESAPLDRPQGKPGEDPTQQNSAKSGGARETYWRGKGESAGDPRYNNPQVPTQNRIQNDDDANPSQRTEDINRSDQRPPRDNSRDQSTPQQSQEQDRPDQPRQNTSGSQPGSKSNAPHEQAGESQASDRQKANKPGENASQSQQSSESNSPNGKAGQNEFQEQQQGKQPAKDGSPSQESSQRG